MSSTVTNELLIFFSILCCGTIYTIRNLNKDTKTIMNVPSTQATEIYHDQHGESNKHEMQLEILPNSMSQHGVPERNDRDQETATEKSLQNGNLRELQHVANCDHDIKSEYLWCYKLFWKECGSTYAGMCQAAEKLAICKNKITSACPTIEASVNGIWYEYELEQTAEFWCKIMASNQSLCPITDQNEGNDVGIMYDKFFTCRYVLDFVVPMRMNYEAELRHNFLRADLAAMLLHTAGSKGIGQWVPNHMYSDPNNLVFKALHTQYCWHHKYHEYLATLVIEKYCPFVGNIHKCLVERVTQNNIRKDFRKDFGWHQLLDMQNCSSMDALKVLSNVLHVNDLIQWYYSPSLSQCHPLNLLVTVSSSMFVLHTQHDCYALTTCTLCKSNNIQKLNDHRNELAACPSRTDVSFFLELLINVHNTICNIIHHSRGAAEVETWTVIDAWVKKYLNISNSQLHIQYISYFSLHPEGVSNTTTRVIPLSFNSTLDDALEHVIGDISPDLAALFKELKGHLDSVHLVLQPDFSGLSIFWPIYKENGELSAWLNSLIMPYLERFLVMAGFVDYDPANPVWWKHDTMGPVHDDTSF